MITAKITNITRQNTGIRVFAEFTDGTNESHLFEAGTSAEQIKSRIKDRVDELNATEAEVQALQALVDQEVS